MSQEFYIKTRTLHEEFQKREQHFLNVERELKRNFMSKREINLPLEEYLQRINEREKENEKTYNNIMKQMEELNRRNAEISMKLEKVRDLRNNLTSLTFPDCSSSLQSFGPTQSFYFKPNTHKFESLEHNIKSVLDTNLKSISTQTENSGNCEKCYSSIHFQPSCIMENETPSFLNIQSEVITESQTMHSKSEDSHTLNDVLNNSQLISSSANKEIFNVSAGINNSFEGEKFKITQQINEKPSVKNIQPDVILTKESNSIENQTKFNEILTENIQKEIIRNEKEITESQLSENENYKSKSQDVESNIDPFISKSDVESMNNEFDFLESDTKIIPSNTKAQNIAKSHKSLTNNAGASLGKTISLIEEHPNDSPVTHKGKGTFHSTPKLELSDKSETSGSVSAPHSPNISIASDSDSVYEKGSSLKASVAYQALLGNTVIPKETKVNDSDSESVDEVENALANVVQKSNVRPRTSKTNQPAETKRKSTSEVIDSKPTLKGSKPPSSNKTQSKLSKNTRKVLGLDTSSGSEVELGVKTTGKKLDDDDEFDFFD